MKKALRDKLTYANVISTLCLFLLIGGGTAFAAATLGKNSVGSKQLKNNAVTTAKIKDSAITGAKVKDNSLTGSDINPSTIGTVPNATNAINATNATKAQSAETAAKAENVMAALVHEAPGGEAAPTATTIVKASDAGTTGGNCFLGVCPVSFPREITNCVASGSMASQSAGTLGSAAAFIEVAISAPKTVDVLLYNKKGANPVVENFSHDFSVTVVCPTT